LKPPEARLRIVVAAGAINFNRSDLKRLAVGAEDAAADFSRGQRVHVVLVACAIGIFEGRESALERLLGELESGGKIGGEAVLASMDVVK
jgi:hypothetical protein